MTKEEELIIMGELKNIKKLAIEVVNKNELLQSENERLKAEMFTLEDIERAFNAGVNSQFEVKSLNKTDILDFHARMLHQLILSIKPPKQ